MDKHLIDAKFPLNQISMDWIIVKAIIAKETGKPVCVEKIQVDISQSSPMRIICKDISEDVFFSILVWENGEISMEGQATGDYTLLFNVKKVSPEHQKALLSLKD